MDLPQNLQRKMVPVAMLVKYDLDVDSGLGTDALKNELGHGHFRSYVFLRESGSDFSVITSFRRARPLYQGLRRLKI